MVQLASGTGTATHARVMETIERDRQDLVDLCLELGNTVSPHAQERAIAGKIADWLRANGIESWLQPITETSANVVGRIPGVADGTSLMFNAHMDTGAPLRPDLPERMRRIHQAWVEDDTIFGFGVVNDKGQLAAFMIAVRALLRAGVKLNGDLILAGVTFETGEPSVGEHQGIDYPGEGFGTWWLCNRGVTADYALVGETSGFGLITAECGELGLEIRTRGRSIYTPRLERTSLDDHPSAVAKLGKVIPAFEEWALRYEQEARLEFSGGTIVPKAQIQGISGSGAQTSLRVDVRLVPGANPRAVQRNIHDFLRSRGLECELSAYQWSRGHIAQNADPLIAAVTDAHRTVFDAEPPLPPSDEISMWRDLNMYNEVGIPSICYGPPRQYEPYSDARNRAVKIPDLVAATQVYALTALNICGIAEGT